MSHPPTQRFADVSVIIAAYNAADTIGRALRSVSRQTLKPREVVVVDDGSSDGTRAAIEAETPAMSGIEVRVWRTEKNRGAGAARNSAIDESAFPILAFLDADDEWLPEKLERSLSHLEQGDYVLVAHDYWTGEGANAVHHHCRRRFLENRDPFVGLYRKGYVSTSTVVARRDTVLAAGGMDPNLRNAQDFDLWLAMLRAPGTSFLVFDEPLMRYRVSPDGIMSHTKRRLNCCLQIAERYFPDIGRRPGWALTSFWFRVIAVHHEAVAAYRRKAAYMSAGSVILALPLRLAAMTLFYYAARPDQRGNYLAAMGGPTEPAESMGRQPHPSGFLWAWVLGAFAAYVIQFRDFVGPILTALGTH